MNHWEWCWKSFGICLRRRVCKWRWLSIERGKKKERQMCEIWEWFSKMREGNLCLTYGCVVFFGSYKCEIDSFRLVGVWVDLIVINTMKNHVYFLVWTTHVCSLYSSIGSDIIAPGYFGLNHVWSWPYLNIYTLRV